MCVGNSGLLGSSGPGSVGSGIELDVELVFLWTHPHARFLSRSPQGLAGLKPEPLRHLPFRHLPSLTDLLPVRNDVVGEDGKPRSWG